MTAIKCKKNTLLHVELFPQDRQSALDELTFSLFLTFPFLKGVQVGCTPAWIRTWNDYMVEFLLQKQVPIYCIWLACINEI